MQSPSQEAQGPKKEADWKQIVAEGTVQRVLQLKVSSLSFGNHDGADVKITGVSIPGKVLVDLEKKELVAEIPAESRTAIFLGGIEVEQKMRLEFPEMLEIGPYFFVLGVKHEDLVGSECFSHLLPRIPAESSAISVICGRKDPVPELDAEPSQIIPSIEEFEGKYEFIDTPLVDPTLSLIPTTEISELKEEKEASEETPLPQKAEPKAERKKPAGPQKKRRGKPRKKAKQKGTGAPR